MSGDYHTRSRQMTQSRGIFISEWWSLEIAITSPFVSNIRPPAVPGLIFDRFFPVIGTNGPGRRVARSSHQKDANYRST